MELDKIEILLENYFRGDTSVAEEIELKNYFSSLNVAQHLEQYKPIFGYFSLTKEQKIPLKSIKQNRMWLSIAASIVVLLGITTFTYVNYFNASQDQNLGTYHNPEIAFRETQRALSMLSSQVNVGIGSVQYIQEYNNSKNLIFK